jgi:hypothetical protein
MSRLKAAFAVVLLLGSIHAALARNDDHELPAPDFGWSTLGLVVACGAGVALVRRLRNGR